MSTQPTPTAEEVAIDAANEAKQHMGDWNWLERHILTDLTRYADAREAQLREGLESAKRDSAEWFSKWEHNETEKINLRAQVARLTATLEALGNLHEAVAKLAATDNRLMSSPQPSDIYEHYLCMEVLGRSQWDNGRWIGRRHDSFLLSQATALQRATALVKVIPTL